MTIAPGTRLGPYEIIAKLGEGGMGVVWKAKDFQLGREVALKVLPEEFTADPERAARFEREAKVLASLNHPNVAQIYGLEASGETRALVMELVEGPTLAERLEKGALPLDESLSIARQIAEALEEAHEKGIIHRDLKPQNIKASIEGKVKVLDFGLAKAMDPTGTASGSPSASRLAASPTLTLGATVQGMILGTAAYMAPEQARGTGVDARADIWAFGVVLYEMLSGRTAFAAETVPDTLAAVLTREIDWSALPESTPPAIRRLLRRCLERKPKSRLHSIADARIVIDEVLAGVAEPAVSAAPVSAPAAAPPRPAWILPAVAAAALAAGLAVGLLLRAPAPSAKRGEVEVALALPNGYSLSTRDLVELAISTNGRRQVVTVFDGEGRSHLLLRDLEQAEARVLSGTEGARSPFFSPSGDSVGFVVNSDLRRVAVAGGPSLRIAEVSTAVATRGAVWGRDGFVYFVPNTATGVRRVRENGGPVEAVTETANAQGERTHRWPTLLPDASAILFTNDTQATTEYYDDAKIEAVRLATGERVVLVEGSSLARFLPPDRLVFARQGALFAVTFDPRRLAISGTPIVVAQNVDTDVSSGAVQFAIADTGDLTWIPGEPEGGIMELAWLRLDGTQETANLRPGNYVQAALSPDGSRVAVADAAPPNVNLWVGDLERGSLSRLTFEGSSADPAWSPDGRRIAYSSVDPNGSKAEILWRVADGSGATETLSSIGSAEFPGGFSPDGKWLAVERRFQEPHDQADIWLLPVGGGGEARAFVVSPHEEVHPEISPDGRWLSYTSTESGALEVYLRPYPSGEGKWLVSTSGGAEPHWSADGRAIYFRNPTGIYRIAVELGKGVEFGEPRLVGPTPARGTFGRTFSVAPDGSVLVMRRPRESQLAQQVNLTLGWRARVERLLTPKR